MNQQAPDLPRSVQIVSRYRALIGFAALLGALAGILLAALNPPASSSQALVVFTAPTCPAGAICGGPMFSPDYFQAMLLKEFPQGVTVKPVAGDILSISAAGRTTAQAEALATEVANSFMSDAASTGFLAEHPEVQVIQPAAAGAAATPPVRRFEGYALLGVLVGALLGVIAAFAASQTIIESPTLPRSLGIGTADGQPGQPVRYATDSRALQQLARESTLGKASPFDG
jgi:hypothetical protein